MFVIAERNVVQWAELSGGVRGQRLPETIAFQSLECLKSLL